MKQVHLRDFVKERSQAEARRLMGLSQSASIIKMLRTKRDVFLVFDDYGRFTHAYETKTVVYPKRESA